MGGGGGGGIIEKSRQTDHTSIKRLQLNLHMYIRSGENRPQTTDQINDSK